MYGLQFILGLLLLQTMNACLGRGQNRDDIHLRDDVQLVVGSGHVADIKGVAFSADGRFILTAGGEGIAKLWDARNESELEVFDSRQSINYAVFEQGGARSPASSPLEWVLNQLGNAHQRDPQVNKDLSLSDWTAANVDVVVVSKLTDK
jgi:WD40 repeat protein